jgi:CheY-like chemotaxis protein
MGWGRFEQWFRETIEKPFKYSRKVYPKQEPPTTEIQSSSVTPPTIEPETQIETSTSTPNLSETQIEPETQPETQPETKSQFKILIVDDSHMNLKVLTRKLNNYNSEIVVLTATNCEEAMKKYENNNDLNLILLDFDLGNYPDICDDAYKCCKKDDEYKTYFDKEQGSHSTHNGIELAKQILKNGYRNTIAFQTGDHGLDDDEEHKLINIDIQQFVESNNLGIVSEAKYLGKGTTVMEKLKPLIEEEMKKMGDSVTTTTGGKRKTQRKRKYKRKTQRKRKMMRKRKTRRV